MQKEKSADLSICVHLWLEITLLKHDRLALSHDEDLFFDAVSAGGRKQSFRRLVKRLKTETKSSVMHRHQSLGAKFQKRFYRLFRIHVSFAAGWRLVSADRKESYVDLVALADLLKPWKISAVTAMKNSAAIRGDDKSAKVAM
jgi:hypothetical protein